MSMSSNTLNWLVRRRNCPLLNDMLRSSAGLLQHMGPAVGLLQNVLGTTTRLLQDRAILLYNMLTDTGDNVLTAVLLQQVLGRASVLLDKVLGCGATRGHSHGNLCHLPLV